jgi:hypothetical protein
MNMQAPPAKNVAASVASSLIALINELRMAHRQEKPKDEVKYGFVSDLVLKFTTIMDVAMKEENNSKVGMKFLHDISNKVDDIMKLFEPQLEEFYDSYKMSFDDFSGVIISLTRRTEEAIDEKDLKAFLIAVGNIEEGRRQLEYVPYLDSGWEDTEVEMIDGLLENLDAFYVELSNRHDKLFGSTSIVH